MANTFDEYETESQNLLKGLKFLDLKQQAGSLQRTLPLINSNSSRSFEEITFDNKFGNQVEKCGEYKDEFYRSALNSKKLIEDLKVNSNSDDFFFHYKEYTKNLPTTTLILSGDGLGPRLITEHEQTIPYQYENAQGKRETAALKIRLNTRACKVDFINPGFRFKIDEKNESLNFQISFIYTDAIDKRDFSITPEIDNDYVLNDMYKAIIIETEKLNDFVAIVSQIGRETFLEDKITKVFADKLKNSKEASELKFLYENIPDFALKNILSLLNEEILWEHINVLTDYDDDGLFSGWRDGSSALINVMKAYGKSNILFDKFKANPAFVKRIYKNLDGYSLYEGQNISNKIIFSQLLAALCVTNGNKGLNQREETFYYGQGYKLNADIISLFSKENDDEFYLQQLKEVSKTVTKTYPDDLPRYSQRIEVEEKSFESVDEGAMYHPLDLVYLVDTSVSSEISFPVPAIVIKALSDEKEIQEIEKGIRIGFDILAIVIGVVVVVTTGNPLIATLAVADIALATTDIGVLAIQEQLLKTEGGKEFLESWEKIYIAGSLVTAGPAVFNTLFKIGNGLLKGGTILLEGGSKLILVATKNANVANFVRSCMLKVLLEINIANFTKNTVKDILFAEEALASNGIKFNPAGVTRLQNEGVIFIKGIGFDNKAIGLAVIYKGEAIASGTAKEVRATLKEVWTAKSAKLIDALEELYKLVPKLDETGKYWTCFNKSGTKMKWLNQKGKNGILRTQKSTENFIKALEKNNKAADKWVGEVADELRKYDELTDINNDIISISDNKSLGDFDVASKQFLIECKESLSYNSITTKFIKQFDKYINPLNENFVNLRNKKVVLAIGKNDGRVLNHLFIKELQKKHNIQIITNTNQIKNLK
ncbi:hypothetical protein [Flavobacterium sp. J27]|uniref:hypothetical protein n=1 Tax=Flavobacterium sp. J27 TaxID=2060419 RepID=UPI001030438E|nr:hypothetical protein [Flavobacterium sp. J27]